MRTGLLILSGFNMRAVIALCRWAAAAGVPVHVVARHAKDPIYLTDYAAQVMAVRTSETLDVAETTGWIAQLRGTYGYTQVFIAPSTEFFNRFLLQHRSEVEAAGGLIPLVEESLYIRISDKEAFAEICAAHGVAVPAVFDALPATYPFVAKPRSYGAATSGQIKPYLIFTADERAHFVARERPEQFFYQEFVDGQSVYLLLHVARNGSITACAQENLIQQSAGGSIVLAGVHDFHCAPAAAPYLALLASLGFHGLVMIEIRLCQRTGRAVMIEANPRMWGPMQFTLDQHVDVFAPLLADYGVYTDVIIDRPTRQSYYFWSGGLSRQQPFAYHHFTPDRFVADYQSIASADLFARPDTRPLHAYELTDA